MVIDDMDKKLLLTIQSVCNTQGVALPWDAIGAVMGDKISGGAVIQHLAKLRSRMVAQGLSVPPPLRRGGGTRISTAPSGKPKATPTKQATARTIPKGNKSSMKPESSGTTASDEEGECEWEDDPEEEYGKPRVKRHKSNFSAKDNYKKIKKEDSEHGAMTPSNTGEKRKRAESMSDSLTPTPATRTGRRVDYSKLDGESTEDNSDSDDGEKSEAEVDGKQYVAAGAAFLSLEDDTPKKGQVSRKTTTKPTTLIVKLSYGTGNHAVAFLKSAGIITEEGETDTSSESNESSESEDGSGGISDETCSIKEDRDSIQPSVQAKADKAISGVSNDTSAHGSVFDSSQLGFGQGFRSNLSSKFENSNLAQADFDALSMGPYGNNATMDFSSTGQGSYFDESSIDLSGYPSYPSQDDYGINNGMSFGGNGTLNPQATQKGFDSYANNQYFSNGGFGKPLPSGLPSSTHHPSHGLSLQTDVGASASNRNSAFPSTMTTVTHTPAGDGADFINQPWAHDDFIDDTGFDPELEQYINMDMHTLFPKAK